MPRYARSVVGQLIQFLQFLCRTSSAAASTPSESRARCPSRSAGRCTHPEKVLFPEDGITKGDLAAYYQAVAPVMLTHLAGRPITMERYPAGIGEKGFWQKDVSRLPRVVGACRSAQEGWRRAPPDRHRRAVAAVDHEPEHCHTAHLDLARAASGRSRSLRVRSGSVGRRRDGVVQGGARAARPARGTDIDVVDQNVRLEGLHIVVPRPRASHGRAIRGPICQTGANPSRGRSRWWNRADRSS
jgi:hypothetical protein